MCCDLQDWPGDDENTGVEFRYLCGNTDHSGALEEAGIIEADAIIIGPADDLSDNEVRSSLCSLKCCVSCMSYFSSDVIPQYSVSFAQHDAMSPAGASSYTGCCFGYLSFSTCASVT